MTTELRSRHASDIPFPDEDFYKIAKLAKSAFGLHLEYSKKALIQSRLTKQLRRLQLTSFSDYCRLIERPGSRERDAFVSALTTNVTQFFREVHHFEYLEKNVFPRLSQKLKTGRPIRIWSAACSTGQEAYSIAALVNAGFRNSGMTGINILGTDVDNTVLETARAAEYHEDTCLFPNERYKKSLLSFAKRNRENPSKMIHLGTELRQMVDFRNLNLTSDWSMPHQFDVIMCRNVAIYFDQETQARLWEKLTKQLAPGGHLFIGHSERLHGACGDMFETVGITTYRKRADF